MGSRVACLSSIGDGSDGTSKGIADKKDGPLHGVGLDDEGRWITDEHAALRRSLAEVDWVVRYGPWWEFFTGTGSGFGVVGGLFGSWRLKYGGLLRAGQKTPKDVLAALKPSRIP